MATWTWKANRYNPQTEDVGSLYSGLVLQHPGQPFWIGCKIRGQLVRSTKAILNGLKFKYGHRDDEGPTFAKIQTQHSGEDLQGVVDKLDDQIVRLILAAAASKSIAQNTISCSKPTRIHMLMTRLAEVIVSKEYESTEVL
jgi:hypothetical protein